MADLSGQALTAANTSIKVSYELQKMFLELLKMLIPEDTPLQDVLEKEMEKGNVKVEMLPDEDKEKLREMLKKQGLVEGKDFFLKTYHRLDGENYTSLFYYVKDEDKILGDLNKFDPSGRANKENNDFHDIIQRAGINPDRSIDLNKFDMYLKSQGINIDLNKEISPEDKAYAESILKNSFDGMTEEEKNVCAKKIAGSGILQQLYVSKMAGIIEPTQLFNISGKKDIKTISHINENELAAIEKRAEIYGLRFAAKPQADGTFRVSFSGKDEDVMRRVFADTKYDLYGKAGEIYNSQLTFEKEYSEKLYNTVHGNPPRYPDGTEIANGSMFVEMKVSKIHDRDGDFVKDSNGNKVMARQTLEVGPKTLFINKEIEGALQKSGFGKDSLKQKFDARDAVLLNPQQATAYKNATTEKERMAIIFAAKENAEHGLPQKPVITKQDVETIKEHEKLRSIISKKLDATQPYEGKMLSPIVALSPVIRYVNDQVINGEQKKDTTEYYQGGDNFVNRAGMESLDIADALSEDQRQYVSKAVNNLGEELGVMNDLEDSTNEFMLDNILENRIIGGNDDRGINDPTMEQHDWSPLGNMIEFEGISNEEQ